MEPLMKVTPGITEPNLARSPLGTEGEMTVGPDDYNPYDDPGVSPAEELEFEGIRPAAMDLPGGEVDPEADDLPLFGPAPEFPRF